MDRVASVITPLFSGKGPSLVEYEKDSLQLYRIDGFVKLTFICGVEMCPGRLCRLSDGRRCGTTESYAREMEGYTLLLVLTFSSSW